MGCWCLDTFPFSMGKKPVEWQLFITQLSVLLKIVRIHWINWAPKPKDFNVAKINECSIESKAFSKSAENRIPPILFSSVYASKSVIKQIDSPIYLSFTYAVWLQWTILVKTFPILAASALDGIFVFTFIKEIGRQFFINLLFLPFLSIRVISAWCCDVDSIPVVKEWFNAVIRTLLTSLKKRT